MNNQQKQCKGYSEDQGYKWICHHRALLAYKVPLCKIEKGTHSSKKSNSNQCMGSLVWTSAPTCSLYWTAGYRAQHAQTTTQV